MKKLFKTIKIVWMLVAVSFSKHLTAQSITDSIDVFIKEKMVQWNIPGLQLAVIRNGKIDK